MAGKTNTWEDDIMDLIFNNGATTAIDWADGLQPSAAAGNLYVALFTADPGEAGSVTNEADYGSYARAAVARTIGGWQSSGGVVTNAATIPFPTATSGSNTITHFGICKAGTAGVADLIFYGAFDSSINVTTDSTPVIPIDGIEITED